MTERDGMFIAPVDQAFVKKLTLNECDAVVMYDDGTKPDMEPPPMLQIVWETFDGAEGQVLLSMDQATDMAGAILEIAMRQMYGEEGFAAIDSQVRDNVNNMNMRGDLGLGDAG